MHWLDYATWWFPARSLADLLTSGSFAIFSSLAYAVFPVDITCSPPVFQVVLLL